MIEIGKDRSMRARALVIAKRPSYLRVEVLGPMGQSLFLLLGDGEAFTAFRDGIEEKSRAGDPASPYPFTPEEIVSLLLGGGGDGGGGYGAGYGERAAATEGDVEEESGLIKVRLGWKGAAASIGDFRDVSGFKVPYRVIIENGATTISLKYNSVQANPEIGEGAFRPRPGD